MRLLELVWDRDDETCGTVLGSWAWDWWNWDCDSETCGTRLGSWLWDWRKGTRIVVSIVMIVLLELYQVWFWYETGGTKLGSWWWDWCNLDRDGETCGTRLGSCCWDWWNEISIVMTRLMELYQLGSWYETGGKNLGQWWWDWWN